MTNSNPVESTTTSLVEDTTSNGAVLDQKVLDTIGRALKAHYDDLVQAPLPQKFLDLLGQLEQHEQQEQPQEKPDATS